MANVSGSAKPASAASEISDIALHEFLSDHFTAFLLAQSDRDCYQNALNTRRDSRLIIVIDTGILQISSVTLKLMECVRALPLIPVCFTFRVTIKQHMHISRQCYLLKLNIVYSTGFQIYKTIARRNIAQFGYSSLERITMDEVENNRLNNVIHNIINIWNKVKEFTHSPCTKHQQSQAKNMLVK